MVDLKKVLMELGNKLVLEHKFLPAGYRGIPNTSIIAKFTCWMNDNPVAQEVLNELGFSWSMIRKERNNNV